ncbi:hypothetical protein KCP78_09970 [Salmonella enterica subsp. enterica]|nr:hypothetical protein KCP78_09970 [Salmonella enterica subsp. enterica]
MSMNGRGPGGVKSIHPAALSPRQSGFIGAPRATAETPDYRAAFAVK